MSNILPGLIERFFTQRLMRQRNASPHTVAAYRDTFRLLLKFAHARTGKRPSALNLAELDADLIVAFLDHLADDRASSPATYNLRLTAIRAFFRFLAFEEPAYSGQIQRVLAVPGKLSAKREVSYLVRDEVEAILAAPERSTWLGRRDHALLLMTAQTGLRLSELVGLDRDAVHLGSGAHVRCLGKGRKERATPLTQAVRTTLRTWLGEPARRRFDTVPVAGQEKDFTARAKAQRGDGALRRRRGHHSHLPLARTRVDPLDPTLPSRTPGD
jgi:integrase/recombinase XerD